MFFASVLVVSRTVRNPAPRVSDHAPPVAPRLEWWLLSSLLFSLWILPWCYLLMPYQLQVYVRGVSSSRSRSPGS
jgi:hypothetical protein